ncbi:MAG TPA: hypothetical protein ENF17_11085 [Candidatus Aminicenantes bacterium]|nr:hypothetical protein [Candidatus Aminicenantes bacterium]
MNNRPWMIILGSFFLVLALTIPILFHSLGLGSSFLPMFYPLVLSGFLLPLPIAMAVGVLGPLLSSLLTGMPPFYPPVAPVMMVEGLILSSGPFLLYQRWHQKSRLSLVITLVLDRALLLGLAWLLSGWLKLPRAFISISSVVRGLPGILVMVIVIPPLIKQLEQQIKMHLSTTSDW